MGHSGILAGAGIDKDKVNYRHHEQCGNCGYFYPANSCKKVAGNISPDAVCNLWELTDSTNKNRRPGKAFFNKEYDNPTFVNTRASKGSD